MAVEDRRLLEAWRAFDERQRVLHGDVTRHPEAGARLLDALAVDRGTGVGPDDPATVAWRRDADAWLETARSLLASPDHAPYVEAIAESRDVMEDATRDMEKARAALDRGCLLWRLNDLEARADAAGVLPCDIEEWRGLVKDVRCPPERVTT
ncbi:MAG: hypothetical protein OXQ29_00495 [Rhodospirillaceae bacterium]|nr:hypothetical protein [Rhodospirillaceae bacterium]